MKLFRNQRPLKDCDVTDEDIYQNRRKLLRGMGFIGASGLLAPHASGFSLFGGDDKEEKKGPFFQTSKLKHSKPKAFQSKEELTAEAKVISHNNFYEFGTDKSDPLQNAQFFKVDPWTLKIDGLVENELTLDYDQLFSRYPIEERIYRLRCVEAWSMVIPWLGFPLHKLIKDAKPLSKAKYVAFQTLHDPEQMPGQRNRFVGGGIDYPYVEGLRLDEATHPLTLMSVGLYGKTLPAQNGAPIRLVVPWKYGFKSIKSIVRITLTDKEPPTTWNLLAPQEYGFYANVNPKVDHPRWSQARERRITTGGLLSQNRIDTQMFNGYTEVADLYKNLDLKKYY